MLLQIYTIKILQPVDHCIGYTFTKSHQYILKMRIKWGGSNKIWVLLAAICILEVIVLWKINDTFLGNNYTTKFKFIIGEWKTALVLMLMYDLFILLLSLTLFLWKTID